MRLISFAYELFLVDICIVDLEVEYNIGQLGNLARHSWDTVGAKLRHSWGTKLKTLGHSGGTVGA